MRKLSFLLLSFLCLLCTGSSWAQERQLAFPGADGYGRFVTGGRGGEVCYVTRTDDCSDNDLVEGTLRWALRHDNGGRPRTILFNVSGTIYLTSKLKFQYPNVSILGQSAPGGGICITGYNMYICKNNVIIRYVRFRAGDIPNTSMTGLDLENAKGVILDHCSMTWSMEECLTAYDTDSTTVQWCIIGEGLYNSKNSKGARAYATQWGGEHSTMHHTLITNSHSRAPRFNGVRSPSSKKGDHDYQVDSEFANNVVFNWSGSGNQYGGEYDKAKVEVNAWNRNDPGYNRVYIINNYYRPGPATQRNCKNNRYWCAPSSPYGQWYLSGNRFEIGGTFCPTTTVWSQTELDKLHADNYYGAEEGSSSRGINLTGSNFTKFRLTEIPYALSGMEYETAEEAYQQVVNRAGASLPRYDEVDQRLIDEAAGRVNPRFAGPSIPNEPGIIDSPDDIQLSEHDTYFADGVAYTNFPFLGLRAGDKYMIDSDADGLPDLYEDEMGLDKRNANDGAQVAANGYTHLENYLNGIADGTLLKSQYETSDVMVQPGQNDEPIGPVTPAINYNCAPFDVAVHDAAQLTEALAAAASRSDKEARYRIFLHNGTYDFGKVAKSAVPAMTSLIGESQEGVIILNNPGPVSSNYQELTPVLFIDQNQNDVYMQDLTIRQDRDWDSKHSQGQAIAVRQRGKRAVYKNVTLQGVQDTYYINKADATAYFETSTVAGEVDFIYGDGTLWFEQCLLNPISSSACITAPNTQTGYKGMVFNHCTIEGASGYRLGRPWSDSPASTYLYTTMRNLPNPAGWGSMSSGLKVRFHEYGSMDANGNLLDLSTRSINACKPASGSDDPVLTAEQAETYTVASVLTGWDPQERTRQMEAPQLKSDMGGVIPAWEPVEGAIGYVLCINGKVDSFTTECDVLDICDLAGDLTIRAVSPMGGLGAPSEVIHAGSSISTLTAPSESPALLYNLMGQPISDTQAKGLYITQGRKFIVK